MSTNRRGIVKESQVELSVREWGREWVREGGREFVVYWGAYAPKNKLMGTSLTDAKCHCDICPGDNCPGNNFPGDICPFSIPFFGHKIVYRIVKII